MSHLLSTHKLSCPQCQSASVHRSRRRTMLDYGLRLLAVYAFRCGGCYHRFRGLRIGQQFILPNFKAVARSLIPLHQRTAPKTPFLTMGRRE